MLGSEKPSDVGFRVYGLGVRVWGPQGLGFSWKTRV